MARFRVVKPRYLRGVYTDYMFLTALSIALDLNPRFWGGARVVQEVDAVVRTAAIILSQLLTRSI
jgi:hypothetical protein